MEEAHTAANWLSGYMKQRLVFWRISMDLGDRKKTVSSKLYPQLSQDRRFDAASGNTLRSGL